MAKLKIDRVFTKEVDTQYGKKYKLAILANNRWYDGWLNETNKAWRAGDTVDVEVTTREYKGKTYYNFKQADQTSAVKSQVETLVAEVNLLKKRIELLEDAMVVRGPSANTTDTVPHPSDEDAPPDLF